MKTCTVSEAVATVSHGHGMYGAKIYYADGKEKDINTSLFFSRRPRIRLEDRITMIDGKNFNISEFERILTEAVKHGRVVLRLWNSSIIVEK